MMRLFRMSLTLCCLTATISMTGQIPGTRPSAPRGQKVLTAPVDSVADNTFQTPGDFYDPEKEIHDTLDANFHRYDPARRAEYPYATLGNLGSPARSLYYLPYMPKGLTIGHSAFDLYKSNFDDFRFYDTKVALTRVEYSQGLSQNDAIIRAQFGRNFAKGVNLSLNYQRINQEGQFMLQHAKNTAFGIGVLYKAPSGRIDGIYHYLSNSIVHLDNGGVDNLELYSDTLPANVPVRLAEASTTHRTRELTVQHHLHLFAGQTDSIQRKARLDVIHTLRIGSGFVKFYDTKLTSDEVSYYGAFVTDDRGMRNDITTKTIDNNLDIQFRYLNKKPGVPAHLLRAGLEYRSTTLDQEPESRNVTEVFLNASGRLGISTKISLDGTGYLGIGDATGEYLLDANARLNLFSDARTWAELLLYQRNPTVQESGLFVDQIQVWSTDLHRTSVSSLQFHYVHPSFRLQLHGAAHLLSNYIYFDANRFPQQLGESVELLQLSASKEIDIGPLGVLGHVMFQKYDAGEIALPHVIFNGQLFFTGKIFHKNLLVRTGLDLLVTDSYKGASYFPVTGQFFVSDGFDIREYPSVDFFVSMQVQDSFKAFFKMENITSYFSNDHFVQIADYPQFEQYFRLGLWMKLFD